MKKYLLFMFCLLFAAFVVSCRNPHSNDSRSDNPVGRQVQVNGGKGDNKIGSSPQPDSANTDDDSSPQTDESASTTPEVGSEAPTTTPETSTLKQEWITVVSGESFEIENVDASAVKHQDGAATITFKDARSVRCTVVVPVYKKFEIERLVKFGELFDGHNRSDLLCTMYGQICQGEIKIIFFENYVNEYNRVIQTKGTSHEQNEQGLDILLYRNGGWKWWKQLKSVKLQRKNYHDDDTAWSCGYTECSVNM
jgi:hypothetical protein